MPDQYKYDLYFSLGGACTCTQILRNCQLQYASYPFDWCLSFIKSQPSANELIHRHKPGIKIARSIMEYSMYFRLSKIWHSILKKFYKN